MDIVEHKVTETVTCVLFYH